MFWFSAPFNGFAFWFDVEFSGPAIFLANSDAPSLHSSNNHPIEGSQRRKRANPNEALVLSTAPEDPPTHWQQVWYIYFFNFQCFAPFSLCCNWTISSCLILLSLLILNKNETTYLSFTGVLYSKVTSGNTKRSLNLNISLFASALIDCSKGNTFTNSLV